MSDEETRQTGGIARRLVLRGLTAAGVAGTAAGPTGTAAAGPPGDDPPSGSGTQPTIRRRVTDEFKLRRDYSREQLVVNSDTSPHPSNDRLREETVVSKFGKALPHDGTTGLVESEAYDTLVDACESGEGYTAIPLSPAGERKLVQPETAWTYNTEGASTAQLRIARPPAFDSRRAGAEMVELYWRALTRDVPFHRYEDSEAVAAAADELAEIEGYAGPGADGTVDPSTVFRGVTPGSERGPYVSQFLWQDLQLGARAERQTLEPQTVGSDYLTDVDEWLAVQRGVRPGSGPVSTNAFRSQARHIYTGRDLCERVHDDPPFRQVQKAAQVLLFTIDAPLDPGIPYAERSDTATPTTLAFNDFGPLYVEKKVLEASEHGQRAAWHKKWNVHRRLRPEEYGGRVQAALGDGVDEPAGVDLASLLPDNLLDSEALARSERQFGTYLLPQAYAEGSPTHPAYPAGHSVVAGAGVTVLKALFDGDYEFGPDERVVPVGVDDDRNPTETRLVAASELSAPRRRRVDEPLTVRGELNKLASNMALGRNRAGIHYRSDGIEGLRLGEAAAIRYLEDQLTLPARIPGAGSLTLTLETFDGAERVIRPTV